jgi:PTH1 family peptidyl-tRNA hydrolase
VGLGNPGSEYRDTRHNIGFLVLEALANKLGSSFKREIRFEGRHASGQVAEQKVHLLQPETYMNESGRSVAKILQYYKIEPSKLLVVVDDMALDFGTFRLRQMGSSGGHNGLKSVQEYLGSTNYARLRIGIGKAKGDHVDHVLGRFTEHEKKELHTTLEQAVEILLKLVTEDFARVATEVNRRKQVNETTTRSTASDSAAL